MEEANHSLTGRSSNVEYSFRASSPISPSDIFQSSCLKKKNNKGRGSRACSAGVSTIDIEMPQDFGAKSYEDIYNHVASKRDRHPDSWREFASAWNAVAYRFRSCAESDEAFTKSIKQFGNSPPMSERYVQERELFSFFVAGRSAIESLCYALFAIGSMLDAAIFPLLTPEDKKNVNPEMTRDKFGKAFPSDIITSDLKRLTESQAYRDWRTMRHILSHRSTPGRRFFRGGEHDGDAVWGEKILIDENTTVSRRRWLVKTLGDLLEAADAFTATSFV
jgi:hypothetical protein